MNDGEYQCQFCTGDAWNRNIELSGEFSRKLSLKDTIIKDQWKLITELSERIKNMKDEMPIRPFKLIEDKQEEEQPKAMPKLAFVNDDGSYRDPNWLNNMNIHTAFLARDKRDEQGRPLKTVDLREYHVDNRHGTATRLILKLPNHPPIKMWVDTLRFSLGTDLIEVLYEGQEYNRPI